MNTYRIRVNNNLYNISVQPITSEIPPVTRPILAVDPIPQPDAENTSSADESMAVNPQKQKEQSL